MAMAVCKLNHVVICKRRYSLVREEIIHTCVNYTLTVVKKRNNNCPPKKKVLTRFVLF